MLGSKHICEKTKKRLPQTNWFQNVSSNIISKERVEQGREVKRAYLKGPHLINQIYSPFYSCTATMVIVLLPKQAVCVNSQLSSIKSNVQLSP